MIRIGVDLGGTKIEAIALDSSGQELLRRRILTPLGDYGNVITALHDLITEFERETGKPASVGVGTPGSISPLSGLIRNANSIRLNGRSLLEDLGQALSRPIRIANDANCFALSEATDGAGADHRMVFGVILGTGVGGGIVFNRSVWAGQNGIAGEWGHNELPRRDEMDIPTLQCWCGRWGCIETYLSGPALAAGHASRSGSHRDPRSIAALARSGDNAAALTMRLFYRRLAKALSSVINVMDPDVIVLGGGLSNIDEIYLEVPALLAEFVFSDRVTTSIVKNHHGDSSGVRGAAWLWTSQDEHATSQCP